MLLEDWIPIRLQQQVGADQFCFEKLDSKKALGPKSLQGIKITSRLCPAMIIQLAETADAANIATCLCH